MVFRPSPITRIRWQRRFRSLLALLLMIGLALAAWLWSPTPPVTVPLVHVIDGDSLTVNLDSPKLTIRLTGIDAVEYQQDCARADASRWPCGREARTMLEKIAGRGPLTCDVAAKDKYDRTLASCRTRPFPDGVDLGAEMVRQGGAIATSDTYVVEEAEAQANRRRIWQGDFVRRADWRAAHERTMPVLTRPDA